jgi:hypothetical protein
VIYSRSYELFLFNAWSLFGGEPGESTYKVADAYQGLRQQILELKSEQLGASTTEAVLAVMMETGYPEAVATLVAVMDGSASLYFSNGGGIIGAGQSSAPNAAARMVVAKAADFRAACTLTNEFPLPQKAYTRFYIITPNGILTTEAKEDDLGNGRHWMSPLFRAAHELITLMRLAEEKKNAVPSGRPNRVPPRR